MELAAVPQSFTSSSALLSSFHTVVRSSSSVSYNCRQSFSSLEFPRIGRGLTLQQQCSGGAIRLNTAQIPKGKSGFIALSTNQPSSVGGGDDDGWKWLLEPIGDGDWKHIGVKVARPGAYEIVSNTVTVGRVPDKADLVIPVATVSGLHARMQKKEGKLYISDLGSTNGTYVNERRVNPEEIIPVVPGDKVTFGDTHLAIFAVSKIENVKQEVGSEESVEQVAAQTQSSSGA